MRKVVILGVVVSILACGAPAQATPLKPGGTVTSPAALTLPAGTKVADTGWLNWANVYLGKPNTGTVREVVWKETLSGTLDFLYQIRVNPKGPPTNNGPLAHMNRLFADSFAGWGTKSGLNVGYLKTAFGPLPMGTVKPGSITRSAGLGQTIQFIFPFGHSINLGQTSDIMVIETPASSFHDGDIALQNGSPAPIVPAEGFAPGPEPSSMVLLVTGLIGLGAYAWRRRGVLAV